MSREYFPIELKPGENSPWHPAPSSRALPARGGVVPRSIKGDVKRIFPHRAEAGRKFALASSPFLSRFSGAWWRSTAFYKRGCSIKGDVKRIFPHRAEAGRKFALASSPF